MNCLHCSQAQGAFCAALVQGPPGGSGHHACVCWLYTHRRAYLCASIAVIGKDPPENSTKNTSGLLYVVISCVQALCGRSHVRELLAKAGDHQCTSVLQCPQPTWLPGDPPNRHLLSNHEPDLRCYFSSASN